MSESTSDREIVITRLINAPRTRVYEAMSDPTQLIKWWGPNGFTNTFHEFDLRPGGKWSFVMHGPDGKDWNNRVVFNEVVPNEYLAYDHGDFERVHFQASIAFEDEGAATRVTLRTIFPTVEELEAVKKFGAVEGGNQTLSKLEAHVLG